MDRRRKSERRLAWIEACLRLGGRFGISEKKGYRYRFALTDGMVSRDQSAFVRILNARCGQPVVIKTCGKLSIADGATLPAAPVFSPPPKIADWLEEMLGAHYEVVEPIERAEPTPSILREVVRAIVDTRALRLRYQPRRGDPSDRVVSPHTIVHAVGRLHVRGWDHSRNAPRDFVLSRITAISQAESLQKYVGREHDLDWHEQVILEVRLREGESLEAVGPDYGLGPLDYLRKKVRKAHAGYLIDADTLDRERNFRAPVSVKPTSEE